MSKFKDQPEKKYKRNTPLKDRLNNWTKETVNPLREKYPDLVRDAEAASDFIGSIIDPEDNVIAQEVGVGKLGKKLVGKGVKMTREEILDLAKRKSKAHKGVPKFSKLEQPTKEDPGFNYSEIQKAAKAKANAGDAAKEAKHANIEKKIKAQEEAAKFGYSGKIKAKRKNNAQDHLAGIEFEDL